MVQREQLRSDANQSAGLDRGCVTAMADQNSDIVEPKLLFSAEEWETAMPKLTTGMTAYLGQYRTPTTANPGDRGLSSRLGAGGSS